VPPAPEPVPVERLVAIGFVRPFTERPVSGVWSSVSSRPLPPCLGLAALFRAGLRFAPRAAPFFCALPVVLREAPALLRALPFGVLAPAVFLPVFRLAVETRFPPAPLLADALTPAPARLFDGVFLFALAAPFRVEPAAFRVAAFLAIVFFYPR